MTRSITEKLLNCILSFALLCFLQGCKSSQDVASPATKPSAADIEVAIMMPLTGENEAAGKQYNSLIKMGLADALSTHVHVTSYDASTEEKAEAAMEKIVTRNTKIILGPLLSPITAKITTKARHHDIVIISMSNNPSLATEGVFVFGHAPLKQTDRIINYFLDAKYKNFVALLPAGQHSKSVVQILQDMILQKNGSLVRTEFYSNTADSISAAVDIATETVDTLNEMEDNTEKPVIFVADDSKSLKLVLSDIKRHNLDKKAMVAGDGRIDTEYPEEINYTFTGSLNELTTDIAEKAALLGITHLSSMHKLAYDLGRMTASVMGHHFTSEGFLNKLNSGDQYIGLSGVTYFSEGIAQRKYDIIKREGKSYFTVEE